MENKKMYMIVFGIIAVILIILVVAVVLNKNKTTQKVEEMLNINYEIEGNEMNLEQYQTENPVVAMYIEEYGSVVIELYPSVAPNTVNNFISLVKSGFYDNNTFHRLVSGFVLQGGDPTGTGTGGPGYHIKGEFSANGYTNNLKHTEGVVSMARSSEYDSAGSQFFIMLGEATHLDGSYAAFGKVIDGMDTIRLITKTERVSNSSTGKLATNLTIQKTVIDLKGKDYPDVEKVTE